MIERFSLLRNLGQFESVSTGADIPLGRMTAVFSENGRGKTTLSAVLRSLSTGDPLPIMERRRLASEHPPHIVLRLSAEPAATVFQDGEWSRTDPGIVVFDDVFVHENVHSGLEVDSHHRQNLHQLVLGAQAVALSRRIEDLIERIEEHNRELRLKEQSLPEAIRGPYSVDDFCSLQPRADIDDLVQEAERALAAAQQQESIARTPEFESLALPELNLDTVEGTLAADLDTLGADALAKLEAHFTALGDRGEPWVAEGMQLDRGADPAGPDTLCPFCAQSLATSPIIEHYRAYFSSAYRELKGRIEDQLRDIERTHGQDVPAAFERAVRIAGERHQFWSQFIDITEVGVDTAAVVRDWRALREALALELNAKLASPSERVLLTDETRSLHEAFERHRQSLILKSESLLLANREIEVTRERAAQANTAILRGDLARLQAERSRQSPEIALACDEYVGERTAKQATEGLRADARAELEAHRQAAFPQFENQINLYLQRLNAGFRINQVAFANTRGGPVATYDVVIRETPVAVGGGAPAPGEPSFGNTLSAGDRNTLALAFFFASLAQDADLADKVVIIDDPISSLDEHRTLATIAEIRRVVDRSGQVVALSHNRSFLCRLWEATDPDLRAALEIARDGTGSTLRAWDVSQDAITEHDRRHRALTAYLDNGEGELREIARSIRPHLEAFLRVTHPPEFPPGTLLGQFLNRCRQRLGTGTEILNETNTQELQELTDYSNNFHHDTNPAWETETINDGELRAFVERALRFIER